MYENLKKRQNYNLGFTTLNTDYTIKEDGEDRVRKELEKVRKEPSWCPLTTLPKKLEIDVEEYLDEDVVCDIFDSIVDKLSDKYGYCIKGIKGKLIAKIDKIDWDKEE